MQPGGSTELRVRSDRRRRSRRCTTQEGRRPAIRTDDDAPAPLRPLLRTRQTIEFSEQPVEHRLLDALVDVARWSGSANNRQPWRFVVLRDRANIRRIAEAGLPHTVTMLTAPAAVAYVLPADPERELVDAYDDGRAAERVLIGASVLGLGAAISWVRPDVLPAVREVLGLPDDLMVRTIMAIGYPSAGGRVPRSAPGAGRLPRGETVHEERWRG
jgi:nitroreductase